MATRRFEIERFCVISSKSFEGVLAAVEAAVAEYEDAFRSGLGDDWTHDVHETDLGAILRKESGLAMPKIVRFLIGIHSL